MIIDKDKFPTEVDHIVHSVHDGENLLHLVHIPLVRCKDCKYWYNDEYETEGYCDLTKYFHMTEMDFCSRGKRKDEID
jgi:hypothetical protein